MILPCAEKAIGSVMQCSTDIGMTSRSVDARGDLSRIILARWNNIVSKHVKINTKTKLAGRGFANDVWSRERPNVATTATEMVEEKKRITGTWVLDSEMGSNSALNQQKKRDDVSTSKM